MQRFKYGRASVLVTLVLLMLFLAGCEEKKINEIMADPQRYSNREVGVVATWCRAIRSWAKARTRSMTARASCGWFRTKEFRARVLESE